MRRVGDPVHVSLKDTNPILNIIHLRSRGNPLDSSTCKSLFIVSSLLITGLLGPTYNKELGIQNEKY